MKKQNNQKRGEAFLGPPPCVPTIVVRKHRLQFQASAGSGLTDITIQCLADLLMVATGATSGVGMISNFKLRRIRMWGPPAATLVPVTVFCDWIGASTAGLFGKSNRITDTSMTASKAAYIDTKPPADSQIAQWLSSSASALALCRLAFPLNAIVEITWDFVVRDDTSQLTVGASPTAATAGVIYVRPLDRLTTNFLVPISYPTA